MKKTSLFPPPLRREKRRLQSRAARHCECRK
jgi:hypothetical protein